MKLLRSVIASFLSLACSNSPQGSSQSSDLRLCDGSENLRLQIVTLTDPAHAGASAMLFRNGTRFLRVDGTCHYWVYGAGLADTSSGGGPRATTPLDPVITGELSPSEEEELASAIQYSSWASYDGKHSELTTAGLTATVFTDGRYEFSCGRECDAVGLPAGAVGLLDTALNWRENAARIASAPEHFAQPGRA